MSAWKELGMFRMASDAGRSPTVCRISTKDSDLSFEFGRLDGGQLRMVRYWKEPRLFQLSALSRTVAELSILWSIGGVPSPKKFREDVDACVEFENVEGCLTVEQEKASKKNRTFRATLAEHLRAKGKA